MVVVVDVILVVDVAAHRARFFYERPHCPVSRGKLPVHDHVDVHAYVHVHVHDEHQWSLATDIR